MKIICSLLKKRGIKDQNTPRFAAVISPFWVVWFSGTNNEEWMRLCGFFLFCFFFNIVTLRFMATGKVYLFMFSFLPEEFQSFVGNLPTHFAVNTSVVEHLWRMDANLLQRYRQLETSSNQLLTRARRTANKLFSLSKRCRKQPKMIQQRPR